MDEQDIIKFSTELINRNIEKIYNSVKGYGVDKIKQNKAKTGKAFKNYLESAIKKYSKVKTIIFGETPIFLYSTYTELDLRIFGDKNTTVNNISDLLAIDNNIIISGIAGGGKSTLLKYLFLNCIEKENYIPIFIELRDINNTNLSLIDFIYTSIEKLNFTLEKEYFEDTLENGNLIFFFDALDEVSYEIRDRIQKDIIDLSSKYNKNYYLVTSRPNENFIGWNTFSEIEVQNLTKEKSKNLIQKIDYFPIEIKNKFLEELDSNLYDEYKSFASNPLLLTIMFLSFSFNGNISRKINGFYEDAFEALYRRHDASKLGFKRKKYLDLDIRDFKDILSCFSLLSYFDGCYEYSSSQLIEYIDKSKKITEKEFNSDEFFLEMYKSINILIKDGLRYVFSHRTFQEYFCAVYISKLSMNIKSGIITKIFNEKPLDKVLDFLFEIDRQSLEEIIIIPYFEEIKMQLNYNEDDWEWRYITFLYKEIIISNKHEEKVSFLNYSNNAYNLMNLVIRLYFQSEWRYGSSKYEQSTNEIFATYASFSREEYRGRVNIKLDEYSDKHLKRDIIQLSEIKIKEFIKANEIINNLKIKYSNQEKTLTDILLSNSLD
ncbi:NACHT domain-containing protein [Peribacillus simplex]|uniref:NACHT domain-containing protein n=1 Tax=Peribacillus simplex TaxID=1478 RepID=UPI0025A2D8F6|nr:NACHT domain-containing protein [Peribacillus simplex]MDM5296386.1 NACHT domain-containing protein [Peribacillus simplex]